MWQSVIVYCQSVKFSIALHFLSLNSNDLVRSPNVSLKRNFDHFVTFFRDIPIPSKCYSKIYTTLSNFYQRQSLAESHVWHFRESPAISDMYENLFKSPLHRVFVYGTLKRGEPNHGLIKDATNGYAKFLGLGRTTVSYPLVIATKYNIPFLLKKPDVGNVSWEKINLFTILKLEVLKN